MTTGLIPERSEREAADWLARLSRPVVAQGDLARFRLWREIPANDRAFSAVQDVMRRSGRLADDPDIRAALASAGAKRRTTLRRPGLVLGAGAAAVVALGVSLVTVFLSVPGERYATHVGERSVIHLADGSTVQLDTNSRLTVVLGPRSRQLHLERGQALFDVAHDRTRPFVVSAGAVQVTATGTRFDIRREVGAEAKVVLLQGQVVVQSRRNAVKRRWTLNAGQELSPARPDARVEPIVDEADTSWTTGRLTFRDAPLAQVLAEANRYSHAQIRLSPDPRLDHLRIDGIFAAGDNPAIAQALAELYGLSVQMTSSGDLLLKKA